MHENAGVRDHDRQHRSFQRRLGATFDQSIYPKLTTSIEELGASMTASLANRHHAARGCNRGEKRGRKPSLFLAQTTRDRSRDAFASIQEMHFVLFGVMPRQKSLHRMHIHTHIRGPTRLRYRWKERLTNNHDVERDRDEALGPVHLRVRHDIVNQEAWPRR